MHFQFSNALNQIIGIKNNTNLIPDNEPEDYFTLTNFSVEDFTIPLILATIL
jgi:hypothetical protein